MAEDTTTDSQSTTDVTLLASVFDSIAAAMSSAVTAFSSLAEQLRPAIEQATKELADAGYRYDDETASFVRGFGDNPIPVRRLLRYVTRSPQNRRRKREWQKAARRHNRAVAQEQGQ